MEEIQYDIVGKIGSMALVRKQDNDIDYNILARISSALRPGMIWVSSGATEIGRLDYVRRAGQEIEGKIEDVKADYAAQGQAILMENYRRFINPAFSVRQLLVEHQHFNDEKKRDHIRNFLLRAKEQNAIPIVNYNDPVSDDENRRMELMALKQNETENDVVECIDNDETAAVITRLVGAKTLLILSSVKGIYKDVKDHSSLIEEMYAEDADALLDLIRETQKSCVGSSRELSAGAGAKLEYIIPPALSGTHVIIGSADERIEDLLSGKAPATRIGLR